MTWCTGAAAEIVVSPPAPVIGDPILITVRETWGASAHVVSSSVARSGDTFTIEQDLIRDCSTVPPPPAPTQIPWVGTDHFVGALPAGDYHVIAHINVMTCGTPGTLTQKASFTVAAPPVPALDPRALLFLAAMLALIGMRR